jgi:hypothetical protein
LEEVVANNFSHNQIHSKEWQPPTTENKEYYSQLHNALATRASMAIQKEDLKFYTQRPLPMPPIHQQKFGSVVSPSERIKPRPSTAPVNKTSTFETKMYSSSLPFSEKANFNLNFAEQVLNDTITKTSSSSGLTKQPPTLHLTAKQPLPPPRRTHTTESISTTNSSNTNTHTNSNSNPNLNTNQPMRLKSKTKSSGHLQHLKPLATRPKQIPKQPLTGASTVLPSSVPNTESHTFNFQT